MKYDYVPASLENGVECEKCKKIFYTLNAGDWQYKRHVSLMKRAEKTKEIAHYHETKYFCSWRCLRAWEKENEVPVKNPPPPDKKRYSY